MKSKEYWVYILTNWNNRVIYTGMTNNIVRRVFEHKTGVNKSYTKKYNCHKLVFAEVFEDIGLAINREKQIKSWSRSRKNKLVERCNPGWQEILLEA
jgi:putative endonuclease